MDFKLDKKDQLTIILKKIINQFDLISEILKYNDRPIKGIKITEFGQLNSPNQMQIDGNELYVANTGNKDIHIFDLNKKNLIKIIDCKNIYRYNTGPHDIHIIDDFIITNDVRAGFFHFFNKKYGNYVKTILLEGNNDYYDMYEFIGNEIYKLSKNNYIKVYTLDGKFNKNIEGNYVKHINNPKKLKIHDNKIYILQKKKIFILNSNYQIIKILNIEFDCLDFLIINDEIYIQTFHTEIHIVCKHTGIYIKTIFMDCLIYSLLYFNNNLYVSDFEKSLIYVFN